MYLYHNLQKLTTIRPLCYILEYKLSGRVIQAVAKTCSIVM